MAFELISWIYISLLCAVWGKGFVVFFFRNRLDVAEFDFPVLCFIGMWAIGIVAISFSLFMPLTGWIKMLLQVPVLFYFLTSSNRQSFFKQLGRSFIKPSVSDLALLVLSILMILFISSSAIIHPDTLNYHIYSIRVFDLYGMVPGIANLRPDLGFQSLWFTVMSVFDLSLFQPQTSYPLSGCVMSWFIIFLISKITAARTHLSGQAETAFSSAWYLGLLLFSEVSWTQLRLTAASASPDFIVSLSLLAAFYFFIRKPLREGTDYNFLFALFFATAAVAVKLSAILILLLPLCVIFYGLLKNRIFLVRTALLWMLLFLVPLMIRNVVASGYPLYPSSWGNIFPVDWKIQIAELTRLQHYITGYARYPMTMSASEKEYAVPFVTWIPLWWKHLYIPDKIIMLLVCSGGFLDAIFYRKWIRALSTNALIAFLVSLGGVVLWFIKGPDPRFGTGFLLPLLYFQYFPFLSFPNLAAHKFFSKYISVLKFFQVIIILGYVVYRSVYFFHPGQLVFPDGIKRPNPDHPDCTDYVKEMLFRNGGPAFQLPDSCKTFYFRGPSLGAGFKPLE